MFSASILGFVSPPPTERGEKEHTLCTIYNLSLRLVKHAEQAAFAVSRPRVYACLASFAPRTPASLPTLDKKPAGAIKGKLSPMSGSRSGPAGRSRLNASGGTADGAARASHGAIKGRITTPKTSAGYYFS